jgi:hypothetical protein
MSAPRLKSACHGACRGSKVCAARAVHETFPRERAWLGRKPGLGAPGVMAMGLGVEERVASSSHSNGASKQSGVTALAGAAGAAPRLGWAGGLGSSWSAVGQGNDHGTHHVKAGSERPDNNALQLTSGGPLLSGARASRARLN